MALSHRIERFGPKGMYSSISITPELGGFTIEIWSEVQGLSSIFIAGDEPDELAQYLQGEDNGRL